MNTENSKKKVVSVIWTQERPKWEWSMSKYITMIFLGLFEAIGAIFHVLESLISIIPESKNKKPKTGFFVINDRGNDINNIKDKKSYEIDN